MAGDDRMERCTAVDQQTWQLIYAHAVGILVASAAGYTKHAVRTSTWYPCTQAKHVKLFTKVHLLHLLTFGTDARTTVLPILVFLRLFVVQLWANRPRRQKDLVYGTFFLLHCEHCRHYTDNVQEQTEDIFCSTCNCSYSAFAAF